MVGFIVVFVVVRVNRQRLPLKTVLVGGGDTNVVAMAVEVAIISLRTTSAEEAKHDVSSKD